ncbi:DUF6428 family protein [Mucilaginibacter agri]|uniref:Uncharacterized protein n=1 Tax=Mucilaginibacter agri TaxID=2695265 RepID=A0A965ZEH8_9SPHI|nr:DUF6428 family protein [Mucilaginibacter agri]NCD68211.1 hypothetical protein [Mucilaginibacter agri]
MKYTELMNWQSFKDTLLQHPNLILQFQYTANTWVDASYHITEIKQAPITSVDCGGKMNSWTEIIVQLWEPKESEGNRAMQVSKALSIVELVEKALPLNPLATVKIEFGNSQFDTRQMYPGAILVEGENLIVDLNPDFTQCKAIARGGSCGTDDNGEECCTPAAAGKPKIQLKNLAQSGASCTPGSGCC